MSTPPSPLLNELQPGEYVDRYQLLYPMARGGMGTVWLARVRGSHGFEKYFVVKTVRPELAQDTAMRVMFLDEVRITSAMTHANVVQVVDAGEAREAPYLVMEYVRGESLARLQRLAAKAGAPMAPGLAVRIVVGACAGLHAAHELTSADGSPLNVVHRDISPQNILVSAHGTTKVIDFGIATARERLAPETTFGVLKGKLKFMAPEQIARRRVDRRADIWSLGCLLEALLTGVHPFDDPNEAALIHQILSGKRAPRRAPVPRPLADLVDACLSADPERRPESADALARLLEKALRDLGLVASESDVARAFGEAFRERDAHADRALATALEAIVERERIRVLLEPTSDTTSPKSKRAEAAVLLAQGAASAQAQAPAPPPPPPPPQSWTGTDGLDTKMVSSTLEASSHTASGVSQHIRPAVSNNRRRRSVLVAAVAGALALCSGAAWLAGARGSSRNAAAAPAATPIIERSAAVPLPATDGGIALAAVASASGASSMVVPPAPSVDAAAPVPPKPAPIHRTAIDSKPGGPVARPGGGDADLSRRY